MNSRSGLPARLAPVLFALLALATVGAFYLTQHLKTKDPLINGGPRADPATINPVAAGVCPDRAGDRVSFRRTRVAFYLQAHSDVVTVYVVDAAGVNVATMSGSGRYVHAGLNKYAYFGWDGHLSDGRVAPPGVYSFHVVLQHEGRTLPLDNGTAPVTVTVSTAPPRPEVHAVRVLPLSAMSAGSATTTSATISTTATTATTSNTTAPTTPAGTTPTLIAGRQELAITTNVHHAQGAQVVIYRTAPDGTLTAVKRFGTSPRARVAYWDGSIGGRPAPPGTYLVGLDVTDAACTAGRFPAVNDPAPNSTDGAGVNVSDLSVSPGLVPTPAGQLATVGVDTAGAPYRWILRRATTGAVVFHGTEPAATPRMVVRLPDIGLYTLTVAAGAHQTSVPLVASGVGPRAGAPVLVVLPALTWQGDTASDDSSDGLIDTLGGGGQVDVDRPLLGLPADLGDLTGLLRSLDAQHLDYDLTTDVALAEGTGPTLSGRHGVLLDGAFTWLPAQLGATLRGFVSRGGAFFNAGVDSLEHTALISDGNTGPVAGPAHAASPDLFGVSHATPAPAAGQSIFAEADALHIFTTLTALSPPSYQVLEPPSGRVASAAGVAASAPAIIGFHLGTGTVVEAGLPSFGLSLGQDVNAQELLSRVWQAVLR